MSNNPSFTIERQPIAWWHAVAIRQLLYHYCRLLDEGSVAEIAACFHPDAVMIADYESEAEHCGRTAIADWFARYTAASRAGSTLRRHKIAGAVLTANGDLVDAYAYLDAAGIQRHDGRLWHYVGRYTDTLVCEDDRWYLARRRIGIRYSYPIDGAQVAAYSTLEGVFAMPTKAKFAGGLTIPAITALPDLDPGGYPVLTPEEAADVVAIEQLLHRYCYLHDFGTGEEVAALFHPEATVYAEYLGAQTYVGRAAIADWYTHWLGIYPDNGHFERRRISCPIINVHGATAEALCFLDCEALQFSDNTIHKHTGRYEDTLVKEHGRWYFMTRKIQLFYSYPCNPHTLGRNGALELDALGRLAPAEPGK